MLDWRRKALAADPLDAPLVRAIASWRASFSARRVLSLIGVSLIAGRAKSLVVVWHFYAENVKSCELEIADLRGAGNFTFPRARRISLSR